MLVKFEDITKESLAEAFHNSGTECRIDEEKNEIYLCGGDIEFPVWVKIDNKTKRLTIFTYVQIKDNAPLDKLPELLQKMNDKILVQFSSTVYEDGRAYINGHYLFYINFGIILPQLLLTAKKFSEIFVEALREFDSEDVFFE